MGLRTVILANTQVASHGRNDNINYGNEPILS